jgi:hypothetical protein
MCYPYPGVCYPPHPGSALTLRWVCLFTGVPVRVRLSLPQRRDAAGEDAGGAAPGALLGHPGGAGQDDASAGEPNQPHLGARTRAMMSHDPPCVN